MLSSQESLPWFGFTAGDDHLVMGLAWSGGWRASSTAPPPARRCRSACATCRWSSDPDRPVEFPHAFVGVTSATPGAEAEAFAAWLARRRNGRGFPSLVTYNTWFTFGTRIDDELVRRQMDAFADVGGELFQLDAGWYPELNARDRYDFGAGLGSWQVDRERFPSGLGALSDHAHRRGLKFAVWAEPERVDMATVGRPGQAREHYLAQEHGQYQPGRDNAAATHGQICLAHGEAWEWLRERLFAFLDEARPDYLKIDLNALARLHAHRSRPHRRRRQLRPRPGPLPAAGGVARSLSAAAHRELLGRRPPPRRRDAHPHRRQLDGRPHGARRPRSPSPAAAVGDRAAPGAAVVPHRQRRRVAHGVARPAAAGPQPDARGRSGSRSTSGPSTPTSTARWPARSRPTSRSAPGAARPSPRR